MTGRRWPILVVMLLAESVEPTPDLTGASLSPIADFTFLKDVGREVRASR